MIYVHSAEHVLNGSFQRQTIFCLIRGTMNDAVSDLKRSLVTHKLEQGGACPNPVIADKLRLEFVREQPVPVFTEPRASQKYVHVLFSEQARSCDLIISLCQESDRIFQRGIASAVMQTWSVQMRQILL